MIQQSLFCSKSSHPFMILVVLFSFIVTTTKAQSLENAEIAYNKNQFDLALKEINEVLSHSPRNKEALLFRSFVYESLGEPPKALNDLDAYLKQEQDAPEALFQRGKLRFEQDLYKLAIEDFENILGMDIQSTSLVFYRTFPGDAGISGLSTLATMKAECLHYIGLSYLKLKKYTLAKIYINKAIDIDPATDLYHINLAQVYEKQQKPDSAILIYRKVLMHAPNQPLASTNLARLLSAQNDYDDMIDNYSEIIVQHPENTEAYKQRAWAYFMNKAYAKALSDYQFLYERLNNSDYLISMGRCYLKMDRYLAAERIFLEVLQRNETNEDALINLGNTYFESKNFEAAKSQYLYLTSISPQNYDAWYNLAMTYFSLNSKNSGCEILERIKNVENGKYASVYTQYCKN